MKINKYPDGSSYVNGIGISLHNNVFRINDYSSLWHLHQAVDAYYSYFKTKPTIIIPNLIDAQADRRFNDGESSGLKLVCKFLNEMKANFKIFHPHNPEVVEALIDNVQIINNTKFIKNVLHNLAGNTYDKRELIKITNNTILMSADAGGYKPLIKLCDEIGWKGETYSAAKNRHPVTHTLTQLIDRQDFGGKDILIIDDISVFGGTKTEKGYKLLDERVGLIYGDSITLDSAEDICSRLEAKGFASINWVAGIGSYTYQMVTRDTDGQAFKATYIESCIPTNTGPVTTGKEIYKDPKTGDGSKKSAKGLLNVQPSDVTSSGKYELLDQQDWDSENGGSLQRIFQDGTFYNETTLQEIRKRLYN